MATLGLRSAREPIETLESAEASSRELLEHSLARIERLGAAVNNSPSRWASATGTG